jgi:hypothetical protein
MEILLLKPVMMMMMMVPTNDDDDDDDDVGDDSDDGDMTMMTTMTSESCRHRHVGSLKILISNYLFLVITYTSSVYDDDDDDDDQSDGSSMYRYSMYSLCIHVADMHIFCHEKKRQLGVEYLKI